MSPRFRPASTPDTTTSTSTRWARTRKGSSASTSGRSCPGSPDVEAVDRVVRPRAARRGSLADGGGPRLPVEAVADAVLRVRFRQSPARRPRRSWAPVDPAGAGRPAAGEGERGLGPGRGPAPLEADLAPGPGREPAAGAPAAGEPAAGEPAARERSLAVRTPSLDALLAPDG